jgi:hypothetical protein
MLTPFVGRTCELRRLTRLLDEGRNIVLTGVFGSGRTMLVRRLATHDRGRQFLLWDSRNSQRVLRITVEKLCAVRAVHHRTGDGRPPVVVIDDVVCVTAQRLRSLRELVRAHRCQIIVIVERSVPSSDVTRLRAALGAARLVCLGPLSRGATERYFSLAVREHRLEWTLDEIRSTARSTHGHPLIMRATLGAAVAATGRAHVASHGTLSSLNPSSLERHSHGDGVRR